ncbi:MAG: HD domain-containing phosphohydrolase [Pseudomonadota bacterium]
MVDKKDSVPARTGEFAVSQRDLKLGVGPAVAGGDGVPSTRIPVTPDYYPDPGSFRAELKKARQVFATFRAETRQMINDVRVGKPLVISPLAKPLGAMVESVVRHPDPMVWMTQLVQPQSFMGGHMLRVSILSVVLGRGMGMMERQLERLAWGGLLCQIGKARLPRLLLEKPGPLSESELARIRSFVETGVELASAVQGIDPDVIEIIRTHHERYNGTGYPNGLVGDQIPVLARLVGIVDWYDTVTSQKPYSDVVISSTQAMDALNSKRDVQFQDQVVEEFVRAVGLYPNGSLVELDSGEIAVVQAQNVKNRTQPRLILVLDENHQPLSPQLKLDLLTYNQGSRGHPKTIRRALPDGEYGLDPAQVIERSSEDDGWLSRIRNLGRK